MTELLERLNQAAGKVSFAEVYAQMFDLPAADVRELAWQFAKWKCQSKKEALRRIYQVHTEMVNFAAKRAATAGRVAA